MTLNKAIEIMEAHNEWRRGGEGAMQDIREIGEATDVLVAFAKLKIK